MGAVADVAALPAEKRKKVLAQTHSVYDQFVDTWTILADAYDGTGGFLDGGYLWEFPREDSTKYQIRQAMSRYHNYAETLVELFVRYLMRNVDRQTNDDTLIEWWGDVDGNGTDMGEYMRDVASIALAGGHVGVLVDRMGEPGDTRATDRGRPIVSTFPPVSVLDWIHDKRSGLEAVKLKEFVASHSFQDTGASEAILLWDREQFARFNPVDGSIVTDVTDHHLGVVPLEVFRPKRSKKHPFIGKPLISAQLVRAMFNRASEEDEVLRDQAFSLLTVSLPASQPGVDSSEEMRQTREAVAEGGGTQKVLVVRGDVDYKTADMQTAETLRNNQGFLVREIYRMAHVPFRQDTKEVESADAVRLQHQELNEMLRGMADDLVNLELNIARHYYRWQESTPEAADRAFDNAQVSIGYQDEFFVKELALQLEEWAAAMALSLGPTAEKAIRRKAVRRLLAEEDADTLGAIDDEIESGAGQSSGSPAEDLRQAAQARLGSLVDAEEGAA